jgi:hypothetical protein
MTRVPARQLNDAIDERLYRISYPYRFDFVRDIDGRVFYLFSDLHQSNKSVCYGISLYDNITALTESFPEKNFDYFLESNTNKNENVHLPLNSLINKTVDCIGTSQPREGCLPNVWYHWLEIRERELFSISTVVLYTNTDKFLSEFSKGRGLLFFLTEIRPSLSAKNSMLLLNSIDEFRDNFPERFKAALRTVERQLAIWLIGMLPSRFDRVKIFSNFKRDNNYELLAELFSPDFLFKNSDEFLMTVGSKIFDLNFFSRLEHIYNKPNPQNIIYYAGGSHIESCVDYLREIGTVDHLIYGGLRDSNPNRCIVLDRPLTEF